MQCNEMKINEWNKTSILAWISSEIQLSTITFDGGSLVYKSSKYSINNLEFVAVSCVRRSAWPQSFVSLRSKSQPYTMLKTSCGLPNICRDKNSEDMHFIDYSRWWTFSFERPSGFPLIWCFIDASLLSSLPL